MNPNSGYGNGGGHYMRPVITQAAPKREVSMKFKVLKIVGKGSYGTVYQVQRLSDNQTYALKEMDLRSMNQAEREDAANEIRLMASIQHPNVISYNEAFLDGNRLCIIMDFAPQGDIAAVIKQHAVVKRPLPEDLIWKYLIQICSGLNALHSMRILHRDVKPGNVMLFGNDIAKIGDLGIAKVLSKSAAAQTQIGTPHYMPPEIWKNMPYSYSSDSWAFGCLLYEMMTFRVPFEARNVNELRYKVLRGTFPRLPSIYSVDMQQIVHSCLDQNPERRPSMEFILNCQAVKARRHLVPVQPESLMPFANSDGMMLETIKVPRNIQMIKNKLPPAQYRTSNAGYDFDDGSSDVPMGGSAPPAGLPAIQHHHHHHHSQYDPRGGHGHAAGHYEQRHAAQAAANEPWEAVVQQRGAAPRRGSNSSAAAAAAGPHAAGGALPAVPGQQRGGYEPSAASGHSKVESIYKAYNPNKRPPPILAAGAGPPAAPPRRQPPPPRRGSNDGASSDGGGDGGGGSGAAAAAAAGRRGSQDRRPPLAPQRSVEAPPSQPQQHPAGAHHRAAPPGPTQSESHSKYGSFYYSPKAAAAQADASSRAAELAAQARARYDEVVAQHRLKGYYVPGQEQATRAGQPYLGKAHYTPSEHHQQQQQQQQHRGGGGGGGGGGWQPPQPHLQRMASRDSDDYF